MGIPIDVDKAHDSLLDLKSIPSLGQRLITQRIPTAYLIPNDRTEEEPKSMMS